MEEIEVAAHSSSSYFLLLFSPSRSKSVCLFPVLVLACTFEALIISTFDPLISSSHFQPLYWYPSPILAVILLEKKYKFLLFASFTAVDGQKRPALLPLVGPLFLGRTIYFRKKSFYDSLHVVFKLKLNVALSLNCWELTYIICKWNLIFW